MWREALYCPLCDPSVTGKCDHVAMDSITLTQKSTDIKNFCLPIDSMQDVVVKVKDTGKNRFIEYVFRGKRAILKLWNKKWLGNQTLTEIEEVKSSKAMKI